MGQEACRQNPCFGLLVEGEGCFSLVGRILQEVYKPFSVSP